MTRGDMRITVREQGEVKALRETSVRSEVEGQATIIYLVPEGSQVDQGDKLVELDAHALKDREANQAITVERANATLVNAQQNVQILDKELQAEEAAARSRLEIAQINLEKHLGRIRETLPNGEFADGNTNRDMLGRLRELVADTRHTGLIQSVLELVGEENLDRDSGNLAQQILDQIDKIRLAIADLKLKEDTLEHSKRLAAKDYITRNELEKHKLDFDSQASRVRLSWNELDLLINYGLKAEKIDLELKVDNAQLELDKVVASATARRARENAELSSRESEYELAKGRLDNLRTQIENAVIYAPTPGLVVYAKVGDSWRSREVVEEGISVRQRQSLIVLPDVSTMIAELSVAEADIDKVVVGQIALVEVDAFPDEPFTARVTRVSPLPDSGSRWSNSNKKVYKTEVTLDGVNTVLRPGMSSTVEILIGEIRDVLFIPIQGVIRQGSVHYVWKLGPDGPIATLVKVGRSNLSHVELLEGIEEGDQILLSRPSDRQPPEFEQPSTPEASPQSESGVDDPPDFGTDAPSTEHDWPRTGGRPDDDRPRNGGGRPGKAKKGKRGPNDDDR